MTSRNPVRQACQECRRTRKKCDGKPQCARCGIVGTSCVYKQSDSKRKPSVVGSLISVRKNAAPDRAVINCHDAKASKPSCHQLQMDCMVRQRGQRPTPPLTPKSPYSMVISSYHMPLSTLSSPRSSECEFENRWIPPGWSKSCARQFIDAVLTWDFYPSCFINHWDFIRDYESASGEQCSKALVAALLALATRLASDRIDIGEEESSNHLAASNTLFKESTAILQNNKSYHTLADIQALGVLALYHVRCDRRAEAQELVEEFACAITSLCLGELSTASKDGEYGRARAVTYCGALSMNRYLRLAMGYSAWPDSPLPPASGHWTPGSGCHVDIGSATLDSGIVPLSHHAGGTHFIAAKVFQLTEWVYKVQFSNDEIMFAHVLEVYIRCLEWYSSMFTSLQGGEGGGGDTPLKVFVHVYFHACIITLFSSFLDAAADGDTTVNPREICRQASNTILGLVKSYNELFTFRYVPGMFPHFQLTAVSFLEDDQARQRAKLAASLVDDVLLLKEIATHAT